MTHPHDNPPQLNIDVDHHNIDVDCQGAWVEGGGIGKIKCTGRAVYAVRLHLIDHCNRPGLDAGGNKIIFCCRRCVTITAQRVQLMINEFHDNAPEPVNGEPAVFCVICKKPIIALHDMYEVEAL